MPLLTFELFIFEKVLRVVTLRTEDGTDTTLDNGGDLRLKYFGREVPTPLEKLSGVTKE